MNHEMKETSINDLDLQGYTAEELEILMNRIRGRIRGLRLQRLNTLRKEVQKTAEELGMTVAQVVGLEKPVKAVKDRSAKKIAPKYRNPEAPEQTWTGRGQMPVWLRQRVEQGARLEDFLISAVAENEEMAAHEEPSEAVVAETEAA